MSKAKGRTPRTDDDDDTRPANNEGAGLIKNNGKIDAVHDEIKETQGVLLKTIEMTLERGEQINSLEDKSVRMSVQADTFKKRAAETKRHFCFAHYRNILILIAILAVVGLVLYLIFKK